MRVLATFVAVCALFAVAMAADSNVVVGTEANFDEVIGAKALSLVEFYAPWCGHCKALAPEYEKAADTLAAKGGDNQLVKVDCTVEKDLCNKYDVKGFPTVKLFRKDGTDPTDYDSAREAVAIVKWLTKQGMPAVTELADQAAVDGFAVDDDVKIIAFVDKDFDSAAYTKVANKMRNEFSFGLSTDAAAAEKAGVKVPGVKVYRTFDDGDKVFEGDATSATFEEDLTAFIKSKSFPLVGVIGPDNYQKYLERGFNFVWIFLDMDSADQAKTVKDVITPVAAKYTSQLSFVKLDGIKWAEHAKSFGLSGNTPGIVLEDREKSKNFVYPEDQDVTADAFGKFVAGVLDGSIAPTVKSEPEPENNDEPVTVLVGTTYDKIVNDNDKDVLVEFYAPWCGHCKALSPKYDELGDMFKDNANVVIAKVDATANDVPENIEGFPTIKLYPAGDKKNPIDFNGDRTAEAMKEFIEKNGKAKPAKVEDHKEL